MGGGGRAGDGSVGESTCFPAWQPSSVPRIQRWRESWQVWHFPLTLEKNIKIEENHYRTALGNELTFALCSLVTFSWWAQLVPRLFFPCFLDSWCSLGLHPLHSFLLLCDSLLTPAILPLSSLLWKGQGTGCRGYMQAALLRVSVKTNTVENSTLFC